ncbi:hypothetical protein B566_EDAN012576 [Ephemera danica]|nr:hypothetical protein B566_EDAN012576 [Ephemera danica]
MVHAVTAKIFVNVSGLNSEVKFTRPTYLTQLEASTQTSDNKRFTVNLDLSGINISPTFDLLLLHLDVGSKFANDNDRKLLHRPRVTINQNTVCYDATECGRPNFNVEEATAETVYHPGDWPWLAAISKRSENDQVQFQCTGTLITDRHVITAAQCTETANAQDLIVNLGKFDLASSQNDPLSQTISVSEIKINPEWAETNKADADLAILILETNVAFTERVRPICLISSSAHALSIISDEGLVSGWNSNAGTGRHEARTLTMQYKGKQLCKSLDANLRTESCNAYPGEGLITPKRIVGDKLRFFLEGVYSRSLDNPASPGVCGRLSVVSNLEEYHEWTLLDTLGLLYLG